MMSSLLAVALAFFLFGSAACGSSARLEGEECFASTECAPGLLCDFGAETAVCAPQQTNGGTPIPDPDPIPDAAPIDSPVDPPPDAPVVVPDAAPPADAPTPDAAVDATA